MTFRHLEIFYAIAQTGSFRRAAERLYITQSAVSHAVRELEAQAGTLLFDRLPRGVQLTHSGRQLLEEAQPVLASCRALEERIGSLQMRAPIRIVSSITIATFYLPNLLRRFYAEHPGVSAQVQVVRASRALEVLRQGEADIALVEGAEPGAPLASASFGAYALLAACAPAYPLPSPPLTARALCGERLLLREPGSAIRDALDSALYLTGYAAVPVWCSVNSSALIAAAKAGLGITVLPESLLHGEVASGALERVPLEGMTLLNPLRVVWHRDKALTGPLGALREMVMNTRE